MPKVYFGRKGEPGVDLELASDLIAVRTRSGRPVTRGAGPVATPHSAQLGDAQLVLAFPEAGVEVYRVPVTRGGRTLEARKAELRKLPDVRFAGGVLVDPATRAPVLYTENLFVKFADNADTDDCRAVLRELGLAVKSEPTYATNAFFVEAPEGIGRKVFELADTLRARDDVEYCHPELVRERRAKLIFAPQWHLKKTTVAGMTIDESANVEAAHAVTRGEGITIAVIDDGVDIDHAEFGGTGKIVAPRDVLGGNDNPRPRRSFENHGTACAGVACANGTVGASGVAPAARLMPMRLAAGLGSHAEAEAFRWAADQGADIISCSWGPPDGDWWNPNDPQHASVDQPPAHTRLAIEYAATQGRGGKGCLVLFAAGNGNESVDNDGYASHPMVLAVAACNDRGRRSIYSDFGHAVWCCFPSNDFELPEQNHPAPLTSGIWTTDRTGSPGYNAGRTADGDAAGHFTNSFGGTSSACPGAAGVAALVLSVNPALRREEVKDILKRAGERIDPQGGQYSAAGRSRFYGWGRLNAKTAVDLARPQPRDEVTVSRRFDAPIPDLQTVSFSLDVPDTQVVAAVSVAVDLAHTYIGDLVLTLEPPPASGVAPVVLHNRTGGTRNSIKKVYDKANTPKLGAFAGKAGNGRWTLRIKDAAAQDSGTLATFSVRLVFAAPGAAAPVLVAAKKRQATAKAGEGAPRNGVRRTSAPAKKKTARKAPPRKSRAAAG
ncbi:MAG: S8 family serine peptidase [Rubrivivax sp.]|nr:S8 family serine peptidase [Rubrivivax sp.]